MTDAEILKVFRVPAELLPRMRARQRIDMANDRLRREILRQIEQKLVTITPRPMFGAKIVSSSPRRRKP